MNRIIKFRVWHKGKNEWYHGPGHEPNILGECVLLGGFCNVPLEELNDLVVLQFTGEKDRKGQEIYEGDIVEFRTVNHERLATDEVVFEAGAFRLNGIGYHLDEVSLRILGNRFENPELVDRNDD